MRLYRLWLPFCAPPTIPAVCSSTVLPLFADIYTRGVGIGPATAFRYAGPAINVLAIYVGEAPVVSIPIAICLFFMMYPIMVKIDFGEVLRAGRNQSAHRYAPEGGGCIPAARRLESWGGKEG